MEIIEEVYLALKIIWIIVMLGAAWVLWQILPSMIYESVYNVIHNATYRANYKSLDIKYESLEKLLNKTNDILQEISNKQPDDIKFKMYMNELKEIKQLLKEK
jgi:hypothetical protein